MESSFHKAVNVSADEQRRSMDSIKQFVTGTTSVTADNDDASSDHATAQPQSRSQPQSQPPADGDETEANEKKESVIDKAVDILQTTVLGQNADQSSSAKHVDALKDERVGDFIRDKYRSDAAGK